MPDPDFQFDLDGSVLGEDSAESLLFATPKSDVLAALRDNTAFPARTITLGEISLDAEGGTEVAFDGGRGRVTFGVEAEAQAGFLVTPDRATILEHLPVGDAIAEGLVAADGEGPSSYALLRWGYDLESAVKGSVALGVGVSAQLGVDAKRNAGFAVVKRFRPETGARDVVAETVRSWRLPRQVESPVDLPPGVWLVAEVDGSLALSLGVKAGYDFSWVRDTHLSGLSGDIALQVEAGLSATVGFEASGRYALVLRRDSLEEGDRRLRLQLFKQRKQGWSFALDARATVQADLGDFAPESLDELLRAILGVQGQQLLEDLDALLEWSDPEKSLGELLAGAGVDRAREFLKEVTGLDVEEKLEEARNRLAGLIEAWDELDGRVASSLWSEIGEEEAVVAIRELASEVRNALADTALRSLLRERFGDAEHFATPAGRWLAAVANEGLLSLVVSSAGLQRLRRAAETTLDVLDGGEVEAVVGRLKETIEEVFRLDRLESAIQAAVDASDPERLDAWARQRLARFLDAQPTVQRLQEILRAVEAIRQNGRDFYQRTLEALQRKYQFSFAATYRKTVTREALVDVEFDFGTDGAAAELPELLGEAIDGELHRLFVRSFTGVRLREATLTHQIDRRGSVGISLPWYDRDETQVARSLAKVSAVEDDGRLLLYEGTATDEVSMATAKARRDSYLTVVVNLPEPPVGVRVHGSGELMYSYSFHQAVANARTAQIGRQLEGFVEAYFPEEFPADGDGVTSGSFQNWLSALDEEVESLEKNGLGNLGNALLSLQVALGGDIAAAWLEAPEAGHPAYRAVSLRLQSALKRLTPWIYFRNLDHLRARAIPAEALFAFAAMPNLTEVRLKGQALVPKKGGLHWDFQDPELLEAVLNAEATQRNLEAAAERARSLLEKIPGMGVRAKEFSSPTAFSRFVRADALQSGRLQLVALLDAERRIVEGVARAGAAMARFRAQAKPQPEEAIEALALFGDSLTQALNKQLRNVYLKGAMRPFGSLLFAEAAAAFRGGGNADPSAAALLQLVILEAGVEFPPEGFPDHSHPAPKDVLVEQNLVNLPA